jgi:hypothetical protein
MRSHNSSKVTMDLICRVCWKHKKNWFAASDDRVYQIFAATESCWEAAILVKDTEDTEQFAK